MKLIHIFFATFLFISIIGCGCVSFPSLVDSYTATISANFRNDDSHYTLAYTEAFDKMTNKFMTQGRFKSSTVRELFFFDQDVVFSFDIRSPDTTCTFMSWQKYPNHRMVRPSVKLFEGMANLTNQKYSGVTAEARGLLAEKWLMYQPMNISFTNGSGFMFMNYSYAVYFAVDATPEKERIPVRVEMSGEGSTNFPTNRKRSISHTYDWVNFAAGEPPAALFNVPANCKPDRPPSMLPLPNNATLGPPMTQFPGLPQQFTAVYDLLQHFNKLEAKLKSSDDDVFTVVWTLDQPNLRERFDIYKHKDDDEPDSPFVVESYVYNYIAGSEWGHSGTVLRGFLDHNATQYSKCTMNNVDDSNKSPLLSLRAGSLPSLFADPSFTRYADSILISRPHSFMGRTTARGVTADTYRDWHVKTNNGIMYNFSMDVLLFPQGWAFPGRDLSQSTRLPLRIHNRGKFTNSSGSFTYEDFWDFYLFLPSQPSSALFSQNAFGCPIPPPTSQIQTDTNVGAVVVGAALGAVAGAIIVAGIAFYCWRRHQANKPIELPQPIELVNRE